MTEIVRVGIQVDTGQMVTEGPAAVRTLQSIRAEVEQLPPHLRAATGTVATFTSSLSNIPPRVQTATGALRSSGEAATKASSGFEKLRNPLQNAALALSGIQGPAGKVIEQLGILSVGGGLTLAVTAGIGLIVAWINKLGEAARKEKARVAELATTLATGLKARQAEENPFRALTKTIDDLEKKVRPLRKELTAAQAVLVSGTGREGEGADVFQLRAATRRAKELKAAILEIVQAQTEATLQAQNQAAENEDREGRKQRAEDRRRQLQELGDLERKNALEAAQLAKNLGAELKATAAIRKADLAEALRAADRLGTAERARLETALAISAALADQRTLMEQIAAASSKVSGGLLGNLDAQLAEEERQRDAARRRAVLRGSGAGAPTLEETARGLQDARAFEVEERRRQDVLEEAKATAASIRGFFTEAFEGIFSRGAAGFADLWERVKELALSAAAAIAASFAVKKLGLDGLLKGDVGSLTGKLSGIGKAVPVLIVGVAAGAAAGSLTSNKALGALGGAASGALSGAAIGSAIPGIGTAVGAVVGGIAGAIGGIFSSGKKKKEEEAARQAARDQIAAFVNGLKDRTPLEQALAGLNDQYRAAAKAAKDAGLSTRELAVLTRAYEAAQRKLREEFVQQTALFREGLEARALEATGQAEAAAALRRRLQEEAELRAAEKEGYDQVTLGRLREIQALEAEAAAQKRALEAAQARQAVVDDVTARELKLAGNDQGAAAFRAQAEAERSRAAARQELASGAIDGDLFGRLIAVIDGELAASLAALTAQYEAQAAAADRANRVFAEDLDVRRLAALGQERAAEQLRQELAQARELEQARADGISEANLAQLAMIQGLEREAAARRTLEAAIAAQMAALREEAAFRDDLRVRSLRARGFDAAADDLATLTRQAEELQAAIDAGKSDADLAALRRVQAEERAFQDAQRQQAQARAFAAGSATTTSAPAVGSSTPSVNLAVGVSETTANRLGGLMAASLTVQLQYLPRLASIDGQLQALVLIAATQAGVNPDTYLARLLDQQRQALGIQPTAAPL